MASDINKTRKSVLLIFVKNPQKGKVKTRLAEAVGEEKALQVYYRLLGITRKITASLDCDREVWYSHDIDDEDLWASGGYEKRLQTGDDLGERMRVAFRDVFAGGYEKAVIIGSDCAELTQEIIENAFRALDDHQVVIGPSRDGGYYLLGMTAFWPDLFSGITWSTPTVYQQTRARIENLGLSLQLLPTLNDIDTEQDLVNSDLNWDYL